MDYQQFLEATAILIETKVPSKSKEAAKQLMTKIKEYEYLLPNGTFYSKVVSEKDENTNKTSNYFTVGIKTRPLTFVNLVLNLGNNEVVHNNSTLIEVIVKDEQVTDASGNIVPFKGWNYHRTIQTREKVIL